MERSLKIKNYRNIGVKGEEILNLNTSLVKGEMGGVITLIGENNLGKSSIIEALKKYGDNSLKKEEDIYDNEFEEVKMPELTLYVRDGENEFYHDKTIGCQDNNTGYSYKLENPIETNDDIIFNELKKYEVILDGIYHGYTGYSRYQNYISRFLNYSKEITSVDMLKNLELPKNAEIFKYLKYIEEQENITGSRDVDINSVLEYFKLKSEGYSGEFKKNFRNLYGFDFEPTIYKYEQKERLSDEHLKSHYDYDEDSIIAVVLKHIDIKKEAVQIAYQRQQENGSLSPLKNLEKKVNAKMGIIDEKFNSVFRTDTTSYKFRFDFDASYIRLIVSCGEKELIIKRNSEGFSWFFNFFFNFILRFEPRPGDIILMDDQGYGLMPQGIHELHRYLRDYAKNKDVTFVIATCNEHFVDLNYLEELRIVDRVGEDKARITSKITLFNDGDVDALKQIKKSIMVNGNIFDEDDVQQVYVEGITDYNYLTAFKILFGIKNLVFIPINGVKRKDVEIKLRRRWHTNIFLVDGDEAGLKFKEDVSKNTDSKVFSLNDIDENFTTIETMFNKIEVERFDLSEKSYNDSCNFKQNILKYQKDISDETKSNFKKVLNYILE